MKMRRAEKAGKLAEYLREKNMSERERKHRAELQALWNANGAALYEAKKAARKERKQTRRERALRFKEKFLNPVKIAQPSLAEVQARMGIKAQKDSELDSATRSYMAMGAAVEDKRNARIQAAIAEIEAEKKLDYKDPERPPDSGWALNLTREKWGKNYVSQGNDTNDCGPSNLAIILNALTGLKWDKTMVSPWRLPFPADAKGATPPWSFAAEFNRLATENGIGTIAVHRVNATKEDLINELNNGHPVTIIRNSETGESHYQTVVAYDSATDKVYFVDPNDKFNASSYDDKVQEETWDKFDEEWSRPLYTQIWKIRIRVLRPNQMIIYK